MFKLSKSHSHNPQMNDDLRNDDILWYPYKKIRAESEVINLTNDDCIIDLTGDDEDDTAGYVKADPCISVAVNLIEDSSPLRTFVVIDASEEVHGDATELVTVDTTRVELLTSRKLAVTANIENQGTAQTDVLIRSKVELEQFSEFTKNIITSLNRGRKSQYIDDQSINGSTAAVDDESLYAHQARCILWLESVLFTSAFGADTASYDRKINEASVWSLIKRACSMSIDPEGMRRLIRRATRKQHWRACQMLIEGKYSAALEMRKTFGTMCCWSRGHLLDDWDCIKAMFDQMSVQPSGPVAAKAPRRPIGRPSRSGNHRPTDEDLQTDHRDVDAVSEAGMGEHYKLCVKTLGHWCGYLRLVADGSNGSCSDSSEQLWNVITYCVSSVAEMRQSKAGERKQELMRRLMELASILLAASQSQREHADWWSDNRLVNLFRVEMLFPEYKQWLLEYKASNKSVSDMPYIFTSESQQEVYACHMLHRLGGELRVVLHWMGLLFDDIYAVRMLLTQTYMYAMRVLDNLRSDVNPKNTKKHLRSIAADVLRPQILGILRLVKLVAYRDHRHAVATRIDGNVDHDLTDRPSSILITLCESINQLQTSLCNDMGQPTAGNSIDELPFLINVDPLKESTSHLGISIRDHPHLEAMLMSLTLS